MSRFGNDSITVIQEKITKSKPKNTMLNHQYIWKQFMDFIKERNYSLNENTSIPSLANILTDWAYNMKKKNVSLAAFSSGMIMTWMSPSSTKLSSPDPAINPLSQPVTTFQLSLIGALPSLGGLAGSLLLANFHEVYGRRKSLIIITSIDVIAVSTLAFARNICLYYVSLLFIGICKGGMYVGGMMYLSEITEVHNRGKFSCLVLIMSPLGNTMTFLLGHFFSLKYHTLLCTLPLVVYIMCFFLFLYESPVYLMSRGHREDAMKALTKLRNKSFSALEKEAEEIELTLLASSSSDKSSIKLIMENKAALNGLLISFIVFLTASFSGLPAIMAYIEPVFNEADIVVSGYLCSVIAGVVKAFCCLFASFAIEKWGRRPLLLLSSTLSSIPLFFLGLFFYLKQNGSPHFHYVEWMPIPSIVLYLIVNVVGFHPVPPAMMNDIFTMDVKSLAVSLLAFCQGIEVAIMVFCFPLVTKMFGLAWGFWLFCIFCLFGLIFIYFKVPETKGKSLLEIQDILNGS